MPGNKLTLSTDDGEQAGEENDRMAPHHLFHLPSRLEAISTRPSSSSSSLFSFLAARVDGSAFPSRNQNENTLLLCSARPSRARSLSLFFLVSPPVPLPPARYPVFLVCRSLDGISLVSLATRSPFNAVTKDPAFSTHITCSLSSRVSRFARGRLPESESGRKFLRRKALLRTNHVTDVRSRILAIP